MDQRANFLALILLDALEDQNESDIYSILEKTKADPSYVALERGISPLHYACGMENEEMAVNVACTFLARGADPNVRSTENITPLHVAALYGRVRIVAALLERGAHYDVYDDDRKTPAHYAIEECHFEVVQFIRDHIFVSKYEQKQQIDQLQLKETLERMQFQQQPNDLLISSTRIEHSTQKRETSTPNRFLTINESSVNADIITPKKFLNKNLLSVSTALNDSNGNGKYTPNRIHYNYDVTSPYYINITHRRHRPQPLFPPSDTQPAELDIDSVKNKQISSTEPSTTLKNSTQPINIFTLTRENLQELNYIAPEADRSRLSLIEIWREKVQRSRARQSIRKQFTDVGEMIESLVENDDLNFSNTELKQNSNESEATTCEAGECVDKNIYSSLYETTVYSKLPGEKSPSSSPAPPKMSLGKLIQQVSQAQFANFKPPQPIKSNSVQSSSQNQIPEIEVVTKEHSNEGKQKQKCTSAATPTADDTVNLIRSPNNNQYFIQFAESYVHTDDENGLVFYEKKLVSNLGNKIAQERIHGTPNAKKCNDMNITATSQSTNYTIPLDYETDELRAELTQFGEPPGPITKSTKRIYLKRLIKWKRNTAADPLNQMKKQQNDSKEIKFSVELHRTVRCLEQFERIPEYMKYENDSKLYFVNHQNKKKMREGHLKQSFIYMLMDPRITCNLPGESVFLDKFAVWKRFLESIFYVGKGKTSRPYSHLYDAMKTHSRMQNTQTTQFTSYGKKISIKKQTLNIDIFKSPPTKSSDSKKLDRILDIWGNDNGVVCLHVFHNIVPADAYTREAAIIDALSLQHLTNVKRGDYYGPAQTWTMKQKKFFGIALLHKAMQIFLAEGESQLAPSDLI